jgi:hemoglobin
MAASGTPVGVVVTRADFIHIEKSMTSEVTTESIYERAGGTSGLRRIVTRFYASIFTDPILQPVFGHPIDRHVDHLTAFLSEVFGGPQRYSAELGGFPAIIAVHRGRKITAEQRQRFVELFMKAVDEVGAGADSQLRSAISSCINFGTEIALVNSNATRDEELHPQRKMPHWHW